MKIRDLLCFADVGKIHVRGTIDGSVVLYNKVWIWLLPYSLCYFDSYCCFNKDSR